MPYASLAGHLLSELADLQPAPLATMHGSAFRGNGQQALNDLATVLQNVLGGQRQPTEKGGGSGGHRVESSFKISFARIGRVPPALTWSLLRRDVA